MEKTKNAAYIFFGTPSFAATILEKLIAAGFPPACVACNPDKPVGRKKVITPPPTKLVAQKYGIEVWQPEKLDIENCKLKIGEADFAIVAAYSKIIPRNIIAIPPRGVIGVHPSLLPKHRGASPIQSALLQGDTETGVTLFLIDEKVDHGSIIAKSKIKYRISKINYPELQEKLANLGGEMLVELLPKFLSGSDEIKPQPQNEAEATYTKKFSSEDGRIELDDLQKAMSGAHPESAKSIDRKIRALNPEPGVWTIKDGRRMKLLESDFRDNKLVLKKIQMEGKKPQGL